MRIGQGIDVHAFSEDPDRPLVLGGLRIEGSPGLAGHSDADAVVHALIDALLSGAGIGDLGRQFGVDDPALAGADSMDLLAQAVEHIAAAGFWCQSASITLVAQRPRLADRLDAMADRLTEAVGAPVSVTASTTDHLGAIGRAEGIAAHAVALLEEAS
jgi:2-C-methyl-D-erythritol 2,4-cyclodiphosphate synthase